jgi:N-acetylmuramoyl-L-alanine amidase
VSEKIRDPLFTVGDIDVVARTLWGEARGESDEGRAAVAWVIRNRASEPSWWGRTVSEVCQHPWQFSCWNASDPNSAKLKTLAKTDPLYQHLYEIALAVLDGQTPDPTGGASHYKVKGTAAAWDGACIGRPHVEIGRHLFFALGPHA